MKSTRLFKGGFNYDALAVIAVCWLLWLLDFVIPYDFRHLGITPRQLSGLSGIFTWSLVHGSLFHLVSNTLPFIILGSLLLAQGRSIFWSVTLISSIATGVVVWLFSLPGIVVGISGVVFAYWGFIVARAFKHPSLLSILSVIIVAIVYGTLFLSVFQMRANVSWIAHFSGLIIGALLAVSLPVLRR